MQDLADERNLVKQVACLLWAIKKHSKKSTRNTFSVQTQRLLENKPEKVSGNLKDWTQNIYIVCFGRQTLQPKSDTTRSSKANVLQLFLFCLQWPSRCDDVKDKNICKRWLSKNQSDADQFQPMLLAATTAWQNFAHEFISGKKSEGLLVANLKITITHYYTVDWITLQVLGEAKGFGLNTNKKLSLNYPINNSAKEANSITF